MFCNLQTFSNVCQPKFYTIIIIIIIIIIVAKYLKGKYIISTLKIVIE